MEFKSRIPTQTRNDALAKLDEHYKTESTKVESYMNNDHYFMNRRLNNKLRKRAGYHGFNITTKPCNTSYKNLCWFNNGIFLCLPYFSMVALHNVE